MSCRWFCFATSNWRLVISPHTRWRMYEYDTAELYIAFKRYHNSTVVPYKLDVKWEVATKRVADTYTIIDVIRLTEMVRFR